MDKYNNYEYIENFFDEETSKYYYDEIFKQVDFQQNTVTVFGKVYNEPRLTAIYGDDPNKSYTYSKSKRQIVKMPSVLYDIRNIIKQKTNIHYDFVLLNYYRDGNDKIGWHSDNEKDMNHTNIASISFGATRKFKVRSSTTKELLNTFELKNGSLFWMKDNFQDVYQHEVPKQANKGPRLNLTFRVFK
jgi:alkylated DNA repair dioxygenase AlkB